jgi:hypothetical protein
MKRKFQALVFVLLVPLIILSNNHKANAFVSEDPYGTYHTDTVGGVTYEYRWGLTMLMDNGKKDANDLWADKPPTQGKDAKSNHCVVDVLKTHDGTWVGTLPVDGWEYDHAEWLTPDNYFTYAQSVNFYDQYAGNFDIVANNTGQGSFWVYGVQDGRAPIYQGNGYMNQYRRLVIIIYRRKLPSPVNTQNSIEVSSGTGTYVSGTDLWVQAEREVTMVSEGLDNYPNYGADSQVEPMVISTQLGATGSVNFDRIVNYSDEKVSQSWLGAYGDDILKGAGKKKTWWGSWNGTNYNQASAYFTYKPHDSQNIVFTSIQTSKYGTKSSGASNFNFNDSSGNHNMTKLRADGQAPSLSTNPSSRGWANSGVTVALSASDNGSGLKYIYYGWSKSNTSQPSSYTRVDVSGSSTSTTTTQNAEGVWYLWYYGVDNVGNTSNATNSGAYKIDLTAPSVSANPTSRGWGNTGVSVTLTANDTGGSGLNYIYYAWSQSNTTAPSSYTAVDVSGDTATATTTQNSEGVWYLWYYANDNASNSSNATKSGSYNIDLTAPTISVNPTSRGWKNVGVTVTLSANDTGGSGLNYIYYAWSKSSTTAPSSYNAVDVSGNNATTTTTQNAEGVWYLWYYATDNATNASTPTKAGSYNIDLTAPTITVNPTSSSWTNKTVTVTLTANDTGGSQLKTIHYSWSLSNTVVPSTFTDVTVTGNTAQTTASQSAEGMWYIWYWTEDNAGNTIPPAVVGSYNIDLTNPDCMFSVKMNEGITTGTSRVFDGIGVTKKTSVLGSLTGTFGTLTVHDNFSGITKIDYSWSFGNSDDSSTYKTIYTATPQNINNNAQVLTFEIEKPVGDNTFLHVKIYDMAGNQNYYRFGAYEDAIKLESFQINDIRDPAFDKVFWNSDFTTRTGAYYDVPRLPVDKNSNPLYPNVAPKKGYAFYFNLTSEYLYRAMDRIEIVPSYYYWNGITRTPVDLYYAVGENPLVKVGSPQDTLAFSEDVGNSSVQIGTLNKLILQSSVRVTRGQPFNVWGDKIQYSDGKQQYWYGKFYVPATAVFVKQGQTPLPQNLLKDNNIIVNFSIKAYKNGVESTSIVPENQTFSYNLANSLYPSVNNQWDAEGGSKTPYANGDVMVYDNDKSALDDYSTKVTN